MNRRKVIENALFVAFLAFLAGCQRKTVRIPPILPLPHPTLGAADANATIFHR